MQLISVAMKWKKEPTPFRSVPTPQKWRLSFSSSHHSAIILPPPLFRGAISVVPRVQFPPTSPSPPGGAPRQPPSAAVRPPPIDALQSRPFFNDDRPAMEEDGDAFVYLLSPPLPQQPRTAPPKKKVCVYYTTAALLFFLGGNIYWCSRHVSFFSGHHRHLFFGPFPLRKAPLLVTSCGGLDEKGERRGGSSV